MSANFHVKTDGQVVSISIIGQWSEQVALNFEREMHRVIPTVSARKFAHLVSFEQWELSTPSVEPIIQRVIGWCVSQGMCAAAEVFSTDVLKEYLLNKSVEEVRDRVIIRRFRKHTEALLWLAEVGFETHASQSIKM